jgi:hypothetical protein
VEDPLCPTVEELFGIDSYDLKIGRRIDNWNPQSFLQSSDIEDDGTPDDYLPGLGLPILSPRFRAALETNRIGIADIQYLPIRVFQSTREEVHGFSVANVLTRVPALNREHSVMLDEDENEIDPLTNAPVVRGIWRAALNAEPLRGHDVIRLTEFWAPVFVSERFADVFRSGKFTGATLTQVTVH